VGAGVGQEGGVDVGVVCGRCKGLEVIVMSRDVSWWRAIGAVVVRVRRLPLFVSRVQIWRIMVHIRTWDLQYIQWGDT
jgi:hypothetical protein